MSTRTFGISRDALDNVVNRLVTRGVIRPSLGYSVNDLGQRTVVTKGGGHIYGSPTVDFDFNANAELLSADDSSGTAKVRSFTFDPLGSRLSSTSGPTTTSYTPDALNEYNALGSTAPT